MANCTNCKFWEDFGDEENARPREGNCRRYPPQHNGITPIVSNKHDWRMYESWDFPVTGGHWWCGEHSET